MSNVQTRAVEGAVGNLRGQDFTDGHHTALTHSILRFDDEGRRAHARKHAVSSAIEGQSSQPQIPLGGRRAGRQQCSRNPSAQRAGGDIVTTNDDHAAATSGANPVLRNRERVSRRSTSGVYMRIRPARPDVLGELGMPHRQDAEDETPVEAIIQRSDFSLQHSQTLLNGRSHLPLRRQREQFLQHLTLMNEIIVGVVARCLLRHGVQAGESGSENHAGLIAQRLG